MNRNLTLRYVFGASNLQTYDVLKNIQLPEVEGWESRMHPEWGQGLTVRICYDSLGSPHQIDLVYLFSNLIKLFETHQLLHLLETAEVKQVYKSNLATFALPLSLTGNNLDEYNHIADELIKRVRKEDKFSLFNCVFSCLAK
jgi:hypothetical protein